MKTLEKTIPAQKVLPDEALSNQIQLALEMMKRIRTVATAQAINTPEEQQGNRYVLPEPPVLQVTGVL